MQIFYGLQNNCIDVTDICLTKLNNNNIIEIPAGDENRAKYFGDHIPFSLKNIYILNNGQLSQFEDFYIIKINTLDNTISTIIVNLRSDDVNNKLSIIHSNLKIKYGTFREEFPEQKMVARYLSGNEKVLEIGGNIGRNSLIIASILTNNNNLVTLESDVNIAMQLKENRDLNNLNFYIENSALSKRKLIQTGWDTIPSDTLLEGYTWCNTITLK